jgi:hypothetical protein
LTPQTIFSSPNIPGASQRPWFFDALGNNRYRRQSDQHILGVGSLQSDQHILGVGSLQSDYDKVSGSLYLALI